MDCIVPAAGSSRRMGAPKQAMELDGRPLLAIAVEHALQVCSRCIVVTGANHAPVQEVIPQRAGVHEVYNPDYQQGMLSSIAMGARYVHTPWFFVAPADMPRLFPSLYRSLLEVAREYDQDSGPASIFPVYQGMRGHPVLVSRRVVPDLLRLTSEYRTMRDFLGRYDSLDVAVSEVGITVDIDTPNDIASAEDTRGKRHEQYEPKQSVEETDRH
ncbi:MAG: nucleotidyltransferase family protein [Alkalispirochaeta sp.]